MRLFILLVFFIAQFSSQFAQAEINDSKLLEDSITDMYVVGGAGLGGAILGLSTLSFVEEPGDHLKNILIGAAVGVMGGVAFVGYSTANKGRDMYYQGLYEQNLRKDFATGGRISWHRASAKSLSSKSEKLPFFVWGSTF